MGICRGRQQRQRQQDYPRQICQSQSAADPAGYPPQNQQQQQNKDNKDQDKEENKEEQQKQDNKNQDEQKDQNKKDEQDKQQQEQQQQQGISKDDAQRLLNALANDEKNVQEKVKLAKAARERKQTVKNW